MRKIWLALAALAIEGLVLVWVVGVLAGRGDIDEGRRAYGAGSREGAAISGSRLVACGIIYGCVSDQPAMFAA
ncbi:MAG: hypothetical protein QOC63_4025 [Mycobacterium sp.]|nr:hypothetical protein [Mycobacterium sp.]